MLLRVQKLRKHVKERSLAWLKLSRPCSGMMLYYAGDDPGRKKRPQGMRCGEAST